MDCIRLKQAVEFQVTFYASDFETKEQFKKFVKKIKTDDQFMANCFLENVDRENLNGAFDIEIEY
jgi:hypothetical protein